MPKPTRYGPPDGDAELRAYAAIVGQAFAGEREVFEGWLKGFGGDVRVLRERDVQAGLVFYDMAQYFGGSAVPTWGIAGVAVPPELRNRGLARELMTASLSEQLQSGPALSTLYPAAPSLYRELGWEFAGSRTIYAARVADLPLPQSRLVVRAATDADAGLMAELYARRYGLANGCLQRDTKIWDRVRRTPKENPLCAYIAEADGVAEGYTMYTQRRESAASFRFDMLVRDLVCLTTEAAAAFVAFFARHRSVANQIMFPGAPAEPLLHLLLRTQEVRVHERFDWMLRIVRVEDALAARGYSPHVTADAVVNVHDETLSTNSGSWKLALSAGNMRVTRGGRGGPRIDVRGLAALYSGAQTPSSLRTLGLLQGDERHDAALAAMFAGPAPWMPDFF